MSQPALEVDNLSVAYGRVHVLHGLSFSLHQGDTLALLGANGAGKTSAVEAIAGLLPKSGGTVRMFGQNMTRLSGSNLANSGLSLVTQWRDIFPNFTVEETLETALNAGRRRNRDNLEDIYQLFPKLADRRKQLAGTLSGGEQQMLVIGRALATHPRILILDEPTAGLSVAIVNDLIDALLKVRAGGMPILLVEQNFELAAAVAKEGLLLSTGRQVWRGAIDDAVQSDDVRRLYFGVD